MLAFLTLNMRESVGKEIDPVIQPAPHRVTPRREKTARATMTGRTLLLRPASVNDGLRRDALCFEPVLTATFRFASIYGRTRASTGASAT